MMSSMQSAVVGGKRLNCIEQTWAYIDAMLSQCEGLKVLLCDDAVRSVLSVAYSQHQLLQHNVVLVDMLSSTTRYVMKHFHCVIICRPEASSLASVYQELAEGNFASYVIYFTSMVSTSVLQSLANADVLKLVGWVEEKYMDSIPVTEWVCVAHLRPTPLGATTTFAYLNPLVYTQWDSTSLARMTESIVSMMLASNRRPVIRYRSGNKVAQKLAADVATHMGSVHATFPDLKAKDSVLVLMDRMDDPVTPLVTPWTYEAMIHELIGFQEGNEVVIDDPEVKPEERIHVLTAYTDSFYQKHRYDDWGQVCLAVSDLVKVYKEMNNFDRSTVSLDEIRNFLHRFPEARTQSVQITRHCAIASELVTEVNGRQLTRLSVLEQDIIANSNVTEHSRQVLELAQDDGVDMNDALRLVMLYSLRYEKTNGNIIARLKEELVHRGCPQEKWECIDHLMECGGYERRRHELFAPSSTGQLLKAIVRSVGPFGKDVQNVLTRHTPLLQKLVSQVYFGTLSPDLYPVQSVQGSPIPLSQASSIHAKDIIVVLLGGATYMEAMLLWKLNQGLIDNHSELQHAFGKSATRRHVETPSEVAGVSGERSSATIEARVTLLTTSMINSAAFINSLPR